MSDFKTQLVDLEKLFCNSSLPNSQVLRSHALEILLSFSDTPDFLAAIREHKEILRTAIAEMANPALNYKALLFLVNVSSDEELAGVLQGLGIVGPLYRVLMVAMKKIDESHLQITQNLLELAESNADQPDKVSDHDVKKYVVSSGSVKMDSVQLVLDLESIKLAQMAMTNLAALSGAARRDIVQKGSVYEAHNLLVVLDWLESPKTFLLFAQFINVLMSLSSDEEIQGVLIDKGLAKLTSTFRQRAAANDLASAKEVGKLLRNLSFHGDHSKFPQGLVEGRFAEESVALIRARSYDQAVVEFGRFFVDIVLGLLTSEQAAQHPEKFKALYGVAGLTDALAALKAREASQKYYQDRIEALEHVLSNWH